MDERRQSIADLKKRIDTYVHSLDAARERLGEAALSDARAINLFAEEINEGKRLALDLAAAQEEVRTVRKDMERLHDLRLAQRNRQKDLEALRGELGELRSRLGEAALASQEAPAAFAPFRARIDALAIRIEEQEARIADLESADESGGLIAHLGRSAKIAILRSSQAARRAEGRRILVEAGAVLGLDGSALNSEDDAIRDAAKALASQEAECAQGESELTAIQAEFKDLSSRFAKGSGAGNPRRAIQRLEKVILEGQESLAVLHREVGARILAAADGEGAAAHRKNPITLFAMDFLAESAVAEALSKARSSASSMNSAQLQIRKYEASIKIDSLSAELAKLRGAAADHERRIAYSKKALEDLGVRIAEAEREIASMEKVRTDH